MKGNGTCDLDLKANRKWKYENVKCNFCDSDDTKKHTITCKTLIEQNNQITYIPNYRYLYGTQLDEKVYISHILRENMRIREELTAQGGPTWTSICYVLLAFLPDLWIINNNNKGW